MPNPYNRIVQTPAEKKAQQQARAAEKFRQVLDSPNNAGLDESDLIKMEYQEGPVGVGTQGFIPPGTSAGTIQTLDGFSQRVPAQSFKESLTPEQQDQFFMPFPMTQPAPVEPETPWYADLPHVPGLSQAGSFVRDKAIDALQFTAEGGATAMGGIRLGVENVFGQEAADFYGKWYAGGIFGEEGAQEWMKTHGFPATAWLTEQIDPKKGFSNDVIREIGENPEAHPGDLYRMVIDAHEARPGRQQVVLGLISPDIVIPVGGIVSKLAKGVKLGGQTTKALVANGLKLNKAIDPASMRYRHTETIGTGQKQIIIVSHAAPEGRRITVQAGELPAEALESATKIGLEEGAAYKVLPADANRIEVAQALASLPSPVDRIGREALEQWAGKPVGAGHVLRPRRADLPEEYIIADAPAFASKGITAVDRMEIIERFWRDMPKEFQGIGDEVLPTDAFKTGRKIPLSVEPTDVYVKEFDGLPLHVNPAREAWLATPDGARYIELKKKIPIIRTPAETKALERLDQKFLEADMTAAERKAWRSEGELLDAADRAAVRAEKNEAAAREAADRASDKAPGAEAARRYVQTPPAPDATRGVTPWADDATQRQFPKHPPGPSIEADVFHGTTRAKGMLDDPPDKFGFGGMHFGTEQAAKDRLGPPVFRGPKGPSPRIVPVTIRLEKPYGSIDNPVDENQLWQLNNAASNLVPNRARGAGIHQLIEEGFDGVIYRNIVEDPNSISYLVFDPLKSIAPKSRPLLSTELSEAMSRNLANKWEATPYPGPQPGVGNAERINKIMEERAYVPGAWPATGAKALKDRIRLEVSKGFDATAGADAVEFIDSLPPNLLDFLMVSFRNTIDEKTAAKLGGETAGTTTAGFYESSPTLLTIIKNVVNRATEPSRTIIHELFHHIEQFIPEEQLRLLRNQWADDMADNGERVILSAERLLDDSEILGKRLTDADLIAIKKAYRYEGGFPEWMAEVMTDKAMRDILQEIPEYRNLLQRIFDALSDIAISTMNFLLRKGRKDEAEKIYQDILRNKFSERLRYGNVSSWTKEVGRPEVSALLPDVIKRDVVKTPAGKKPSGPIVRKVNAPALLPDLFGDRELLHVVDASSGMDEVVAVMEIRRVVGEGAEVVAFYPTVAKVGPGTFGPDGIKRIVRQIGDIYPDINNMDFAGKLLREGPEAGAEGFTGSAWESMTQRLWASDISDEAADAVNAGFPRASSVDAARMEDAGLAGQRALAGVLPSPTHTGYHHTMADRINEARGMEALSPEARAILGNVVWPIRPGELLYDMADYGSHNILFDKPGLTNTLANWVPGSGRVLGAWNRAQLEQFDPIKAIGHEVELFKDIEKSRVRTAVLAWRAEAYPILGFKQIRSKWDMVNNRQGVWRAEKVTGYDEKLVRSPSSTHGTIDDILKDMDEVKKGNRVPSQLVNGVERTPPGKQKQIYFLTEQQTDQIKMAQDMMEQSLRRNQEIGVDVIALASSYWHRMILKGPRDQTDSALEAAMDAVHGHKGLQGAKKNYQYTRVFDDIDELDKGGFVWETDPAARMLARLDAGIETFAHKKAYDKVLNLKTPEGRAFLTRRERLGTLAEDSTERGLYVSGGPKAILALDAARTLRVEARKLYKRNPTPENELTMRRADAQFLTSYRNYRAADAKANKNYFEAVLNGKINDRALIDEIYENVHIPQVQNARMSAGKGGGQSQIAQYGAESMQLFRAMMTNVDLAAMGIQGQTLIYRDPASWFTAVTQSIRAIVKEPEAWIKKNREFLDEGQSLGAILRPTEWMFDPTGIASIPTRIPLFGPAFRGFQRSFEWFIIVGQTELYKSMRSSKLLKGAASRDEFIPLQSDEALQTMVDAGKAIRKELGTENMAILGIRPTQRTIEQLTFFASRFMRANIGLVSLALRPTRGADSIEAKRALLSMLAGGTAMLTGAHYALTGRPPNVHDPFAPDWFQIPIGKTYYNFMGPLYPYFRAVAQAAQRTKEGDPDQALTIARRFLNSKAGLPIRALKVTGEMMVTGESRTFEGEAIDPSLKGVATAAKEFTVPLSVTGIADALSEGRHEAIISEVFGLTGRAHPNAQMDILFQRHINDPKHDLYKDRTADDIPTGGTWYDASPLEKSFMEQTYPTIAADILQSGQGDYGKASREFAVETADAIQKQTALSELLYVPVQGQPIVDGVEFRARLEDIQKERYARHEKIIKDYDLFTEPPKIKSEQEQDLYDYHQVFENAKDTTGNITWAKLDQEMGEFEERIGEKRLKYILKQTGLENSPVVKQLRNDKRALQEVWDYRDELMQQQPLSLQHEYYNYKNLPVTLQRQANPAVKQLVTWVSHMTANWLMERDIAGDKTAGFLEEKLVYWGYETTPLTERGINELKKLNDIMGFEGMDPRTNRPDLYPEVFGTQKANMNNTSSPAEETAPTPPWLQSVLSGR